MSKFLQEAFRLPIRVYIEDTDAGGIVYYVNYLKFMERARSEMFRSLGFGKRIIVEHEHMFVVHKVDVGYKAPARLDDELVATAAIVKRGAAYLDFEQQVLRGDESLCEGVIRVVCVNTASMKPTPIPADIVAAFEQSNG